MTMKNIDNKKDSKCNSFIRYGDCEPDSAFRTAVNLVGSTAFICDTDTGLAAIAECAEVYAASFADPQDDGFRLRDRVMLAIASAIREELLVRANERKAQEESDV